MDLTKKGSSVFFFPEGTRSKDGKLGTFKVSSHQDSYNLLGLGTYLIWSFRETKNRNSCTVSGC
jgi:hypothetical protein